MAEASGSPCVRKKVFVKVSVDLFGNMFVNVFEEMHIKMLEVKGKTNIVYNINININTTINIQKW